MTNKEIFIETVETLFNHAMNTVPQEAIDYFEMFKSTAEEKPVFTENGANVLLWMQKNYNAYNNVLKAKDIGDGLFCSSRAVSGAMRKLIADGCVTKIVATPVCYSLTDLGKTIEVVVPSTKER